MSDRLNRKRFNVYTYREFTMIFDEFAGGVNVMIEGTSPDIIDFAKRLCSQVGYAEKMRREKNWEEADAQYTQIKEMPGVTVIHRSDAWKKVKHTDSPEFVKVD